MTTRLEVLKAELAQLEADDNYGHAAYDWLCEQVEALEREEKAKASAPQSSATTTEPDGDPVAALQAEMESAITDPSKLTDSQRDELVTRFNEMVIEAGTAGAERIDVSQLTKDMLGAGDGSALDDQAREALLRRYNQAVIQGPGERTAEALRGDLDSGDLPARMAAATELLQRGLLDDGVADELVSSYNAEVAAAGERGLPVGELPEELRPAAEAILAAQAALEVPPDPADAAVWQLNQAMSKMKPPTVAEQLEALGVQVEPEQVPEPASQEA